MSSQSANNRGDKPLISVILPVYNGEKYILQAIRSVLDQDYENLELILIDDGSSDDTRPLYSGIEDDRFIVIRFDSNRGLITALNTGIERSRGKYIARMDADDVCFPDRIAEQVSYMEQHPYIGVLGTSFIVDHNGKKRERPITTGSDQIKANFLFRNAINHPTVMIRKSTLDVSKCRYRTVALHAEDLDLWINLIPFAEFENLKEPLVTYRSHAEQISVTQALKQRETIGVLLDNLLRQLNIYATPEELDLHLTLFYREFKPDIFYLDNAEKWLRKIIAANQKVKLFKPKVLEAVVGQLWFLICTSLATQGMKTDEVYHASALKRPYKPPLNLRFRFFVKNLRNN